MDDKIIFTAILILAAAGVTVGFSLSSVSEEIWDTSGLLASVSAAIGSDSSNISGDFLVSFDDFKNVHKTTLDAHTPVKVFGIVSPQKNTDPDIFYAFTDRGLFFSRNGALSWGRLVASGNEWHAASPVFSVLPLGQDEKNFFISVFSGNRGAVYRTRDAFFTLEKLIDFENEAAYDLHLSGNYLYLALSSGQLISLKLDAKTTRAVRTFSSPIIKIEKSVTGHLFLSLKSGEVLVGDGIEGEWRELKAPGNNFFFGSPTIISHKTDSEGILYVLTKGGLFQSYDSGKSFSPIKTIPLQEKAIDTFGLKGSQIYAIAKNRMFFSDDLGRTWRLQDLYPGFRAGTVSFFNQRAIIAR